MVKKGRCIGLLCAWLVLAYVSPFAAKAKASRKPAASAATALYEDTLDRFSIELPTGWAFSPQPGDTVGVYFRKVAEGMPANATVRCLQFTVPIDLESLAARIAAASDQEPGFRLLMSEPTEVAGVPALKRRFVTYVNGDKRLAKVVEQRIMVVGGFKGYIVHAETLAEVFGSFEKDFAKLFASFVPRDGAKPIPATSRTKVRHFDPARLVGSWAGGPHHLLLSPGGVVVLDGQHGNYRVQHGVMILHIGDSERVHEFQLEGDALQLSGGAFGPGQTFSRGKKSVEPSATP